MWRIGRIWNWRPGISTKRLKKKSLPNHRPRSNQRLTHSSRKRKKRNGFNRWPVQEFNNINVHPWMPDDKCIENLDYKLPVPHSINLAIHNWYIFIIYRVNFIPSASRIHPIISETHVQINVHSSTPDDNIPIRRDLDKFTIVFVLRVQIGN